MRITTTRDTAGSSSQVVSRAHCISHRGLRKSIHRSSRDAVSVTWNRDKIHGRCVKEKKKKRKTMRKKCGVDMLGERVDGSNSKKSSDAAVCIVPNPSETKGMAGGCGCSFVSPVQDRGIIGESLRAWTEPALPLKQRMLLATA